MTSESLTGTWINICDLVSVLALKICFRESLLNWNLNYLTLALRLIQTLLIIYLLSICF